MVHDYNKSIEYKFNSGFFNNTVVATSNISKILSCSDISEIYLVTDEATGTKYVVKKIMKFKRFITEETLKILLNIDSDQIVKIYDYIIDDDDVYLIKEYAEGEILEKIMLQNKTLIESDLKNIMMQMCEILEYLHTLKDHKLVLRDLKPANIVYQRNGKLKLIDAQCSHPLLLHLGLHLGL